MKNMPVEYTPPPPTSRLVITEAQAKKISVGDKVSLTVSGKVKGINQCYDRKGKYDLEIENPSVSGYEDNNADKEFKKMTGKSNAV